MSPFHPNNCKDDLEKEDKIRKCKSCHAQIGWHNKYDYCWPCYCKSPERKDVANKTVKKRPNYDGENNPHYRGGLIKLICPCSVIFEVYPARKNTAKYCSTKCKKRHSISKTKIFEYKGIKLRSSWELAFAQYLDSKNYNWKHEPETFQTSHGFYTPDFWVEELKSYVEVKGYFRKDAKDKFDEFSKTHPIILADKEYLLSLGFIRIKSGPQKGQLCQPAVLP